MLKLLKLATLLLEDLARLTDVSIERDLLTLRSRSTHEGLSFLTITLPQFSADVFTALERGEVESDLFIGWRKRQCLPAFLQGFTRLVFDAQTGRVLENANITALSAIRQIGSFFKKIKLPCTKSRTKKALLKYILTDETLDSAYQQIADEQLRIFAEISDLLCNRLFWDFDPNTLVYYHGPGSTADRRTGNQKYIQSGLHVNRELSALISVGHGFLWNSEESYYHDMAYTPLLTHDIVIGDQLPVRVTTVPKTLKTPRVIAMEPTTMLLFQQGIKAYIVGKLETDPLTKGHINFASQDINKRLALKASLDRGLATLDLSEASDRVHNELVKLMFRSNQTLSRYVQCARTQVAILPDGHKLALHKFASMGSALCFPIESLFFLAVVLAGRYEALCKRKQIALPITLSLIKALIREIYVYGDDLLCPADEFSTVSDSLHRYGNVVGLTKSFSSSFFRESCGCDAYKGVDITPIYMRQQLPKRRAQAAEVISTLETANQLYKKGLTGMASYMRDHITRLMGLLPTFEELDHEGLGWAWGINLGKTRYNPVLQRLEVRTCVPTPLRRQDVLDGYPALWKCLLGLERRMAEKKRPFIFSSILNLPIPTDPEHLQRSEIRFSTCLKWRWVALR